MKKALFFLLLIVSVAAYSQQMESWSEDFSDGDFTQNPEWRGTTENFVVNTQNQLQSNAGTTSKSYLSTVSEIFDNAVWEFWVRINYNPTSQNYAMIYLVSDREDISGDVNGYYVQIGNTLKEISLYRQQGSKRTKIIDGEDRTIDSNPVIVKVRVTRTSNGEFELFRQRFSAVGEPIDVDFVQEGEAVIDMQIQGSRYFGLLYVNSGATGKNYLFDDILVMGKKFKDSTPPEWIDFSIRLPNQLELSFSESIDVSSAKFLLDQNMGTPDLIQQSPDKTTLLLRFSKNFESGKFYTLQLNGITDLSGNELEETLREIALLENPESGDLIINEILFDVSNDNAEFIELYNRSDKILDLTKVFYGVRGAAAFRPSNFFPKGSLLKPNGYVAISPDIELLRQFYRLDRDFPLLQAEKWSTLNNSGAQLLIGMLGENDTIFLDEVHYDAKWHHPLVKNAKNVSLERIHPDMVSNSADSWHSAASEVGYATAGTQNSQFFEVAGIAPNDEKWVWTEREYFSPDNDGIDDICLIHYRTDNKSYMANVIIFNAVGVKVCQLASNVLLAPDGFLIWDGKTDRGQNVNPGIYVLFFEMINPINGVKKIEKLPVVVSSR